MYKAKQDRIYEDGRFMGWFPRLPVLAAFVVSALNDLAKVKDTSCSHDRRRYVGYPDGSLTQQCADCGQIRIKDKGPGWHEWHQPPIGFQLSDKAYFSAVTRPGSFGMPSQFVQEADPAMSGTATCNHDRLLHLAGGVQWCRKCGSVRVNSSQMWKVPYRESERGR